METMSPDPTIQVSIWKAEGTSAGPVSAWISNNKFDYTLDFNRGTKPFHSKCFSGAPGVLIVTPLLG